MKRPIIGSRPGLARLVLIVIAAMLLLSAYLIHQADKPETIQTEITVREGETLWSIAETNCPNKDPREVIHQIEKVNHLGEYLRPGDVLTIPKEVGAAREASK